MNSEFAPPWRKPPTRSGLAVPPLALPPPPARARALPRPAAVALDQLAVYIPVVEHQRGDVVFREPEASLDLHVQTFSSRPSLTSPTIPFARREQRKPMQEMIIVEAQDQSQPPPRALNRHQRRAQESIARKKGRASSKAPSTRNPLATRPGPGSDPLDPRLLLLQHLCKWTVEGINEDGTYLSFLTQFANGSAIVVMDPTDELTAAEIVRNINAPVAPEGLIGMLIPAAQGDQFQMARSCNTNRTKDMEKVLAIVTESINTKFAQLKEQIRHDTANRSDDQPAGSTSAGAEPPAGPGGGDNP